MNHSIGFISLEPEQMRKLGYQMIDRLVRHYETLDQQPFIQPSSAATLKSFIPDHLPLEPSPPEQVFDHIFKDVFTNLIHTNHPRFFSFVPSPGNYISSLADLLSSGFNVFAGHWFAGSGAAQIEIITIQWLLKICGFSASGGGIFVSGGSMANLSAIATARKIKGCQTDSKRNIIYYSVQTHSSLVKGLTILGFETHQMRPITVNNNFELDVEALRQAITQDLQQGLHPICIVGNAGTTNTGTVDDLINIAAIAKEYNLWFHIDGAYGAAAVLSHTHKDQLSGLELADSLTVDPHKWWFQPYELGCLLVKKSIHLKETFSVTAEYLKDVQEKIDQEINFFEYGIQLTRSFKALKLYVSLKAFGINAFIQAVDHGIALAEYTEDLLKSKSHWEITSTASLAVITFRYRSEGWDDQTHNQVNKKISESISKDGFALIVTTMLKNQIVLRMCTIHPALNKWDIHTTVDKLDQFAEYHAKKVTEAQF